MNQHVLAVKPWHFGALSYIVMIYAATGDNRMTRQWAPFRLSSATSLRRRSRWAQRAISDLKQVLHEDELVLEGFFFGAPMCMLSLFSFGQNTK